MKKLKTFFFCILRSLLSSYVGTPFCDKPKSWNILRVYNLMRFVPTSIACFWTDNTQAPNPMINAFHDNNQTLGNVLKENHMDCRIGLCVQKLVKLFVPIDANAVPFSSRHLPDNFMTLRINDCHAARFRFGSTK